MAIRNSAAFGFVFICIALFPSAGFAQDDAAAFRARVAAEDAERARQTMEAQRQFEETLKRSNAAMNDLMKGTPYRGDEAEYRWRALQLREQSVRFREAFNQFQIAQNDLSQAAGPGRNLKATASRLEKSTKVMLDIVKTKGSPRPDASAFARLSAGELALESLTTAKRVAPQLAVIAESGNKPTVDAQVLSSFTTVEDELRRLQTLLRLLKNMSF